MDFKDFTLFDVFWKNNSIYLIISINNEVLNEKNLIVSLNQINLNLKEKIVKNKYEPILLFIYDDKNIYTNIDTNINRNKDLTIRIVYKEQEFIKNIEKVINKENSIFLSLTTLFKDDYILFPNFYKYYKSQGVEHFFMYYNGLLNDDIKKLFDYNDVTLIEWNFIYWTNNKYTHHAQLGQMHHALYKFGKNNYEYMIFNDLDEYLFIPDIKLIDYIKLNPTFTSFGFKNVWAKTLDNSINFQKNLIIAEPLNFPNRSKCIYLVSSLKLLNIHYVDECLGSKVQNNENIMYHFYNWCKKNRVEKTNNSIKLNLDFLKYSITNL
jgi:hypothetical protein